MKLMIIFIFISCSSINNQSIWNDYLHESKNSHSQLKGYTVVVNSSKSYALIVEEFHGRKNLPGNEFFRITIWDIDSKKLVFSKETNSPDCQFVSDDQIVFKILPGMIKESDLSENNHAVSYLYEIKSNKLILKQNHIEENE